MQKRDRAESLMLALLVGFAVLAIVPEAEAAQKNPSQLVETTHQVGATGWKWLMTAASFVVGGGALASGGRALYKGDWTTGGIGIGFGIGVLLLMWALGGFFDYNTTAAILAPTDSATVLSS